METGTDLQQDNAVNVFNHMLVLHFYTQLLKHLIVTSAISVMWFAVQKQRFLNVTHCSQHHFNAKRLWLWISSVRTKWGASPANVHVFLWVRNGDTTLPVTICSRNALPSVWNQWQCSSCTDIQCSLCVCQQVWDALWTHSAIPQYHTIVCVVLTPIFIPLTRDEQSNICPCVAYSWLTKILWITDSVSLFNYWHVCHSLPSCWQHSVPTHNHCHQYTCTTDGSDLPINFSRLTTFYSKKLNTIFWSNLDSSASWWVFEPYHTAVHPVPCIVLHKCLPMCLPG